MNIAINGGGQECVELLHIAQQHDFKEIHPNIVAVADIDEGAPGFVLAKKKGLYVTRDYNDFFARKDIDLIIELTDNMDIYNDILKKKSKNVRAISTLTAKLFREIAIVSRKQKKTSQELYETQTMYKTMINELIQEDVLVIGHDYHIIDVNDTVLNRLGLSREEVIGQYCFQITHRQNHPCTGTNHPCPLIETMETIKPSQTTHVHLDKNNKEVYFSIATYPLIEGKDIIGVIEISRDITKEINIQKTMMHQEKLASVGRLSAGVAHEINNPLTTILTTSMLLQEDIGPVNPLYPELETITKETLRCRKIVTSLLDFSRQSQPNKKLNDLNDIARESVLLTKKQAAFKDVTVEQHLLPDIPRAHVDKGQIQQTLINLILNAAESTDAGGVIRVSTSLDARRKQIHITISDTGEGIPDDMIDKIFDPFFTTKADGSGLGLAITHGIIEQHGGTIDVQSKVGEGTIFTIRIPMENGMENEPKQV